MIEGIERKTVELIPENAFREAVANSLVHREWDINSHIRIAMFSDRIEVTSPSGLPRGITKEELEAALNEPVLISDGNPDKPNSPGQLLKHYAPSKRLRINVTEPESDELFIGFGPDYPYAQMNLSPKGNLREAAAHLFQYLRDADKQATYPKLAMAPIPQEGLGLAINDRIRRASFKG